MSDEIPQASHASCAGASEAEKTPIKQRLGEFNQRMRAAGFRRVQIYVHPDLLSKLDAERREGETKGATLERLLLGEAKSRPSFRRPGELTRREKRAERRSKYMRDVLRKHVAKIGNPSLSARLAQFEANQANKERCDDQS